MRDKTTKTILMAGCTALALTFSAGAALAKADSQVRDIKGFTGIENKGSVDLKITVGPKFKVTIKAEDDELSEIQTVMHGDTLQISRDSRTRFVIGHYYSARVEIEMPDLQSLSAKGSGDITVDGLKTNDFELEQKGSGDISLDGSCKTGDFSFAGSGDFSSDELFCDMLTFESRGSGDSDIENLTAKTFTVTSKGSGDMDVEGTCDTLDITFKGSGDFSGRSLECKDAHIETVGSGDVDFYASKSAEIRAVASGDVDMWGKAEITKSDIGGSSDFERH